MTNKLFIKKIDGECFFLSKSIEDTRDVTQYEPVLERGNLPELLGSLSDIPEEFYARGVKVNYSYEPALIKIPEHVREAINSFVRTLERLAFEKSLENLKL
jgi:hypothetical protein